MTHAIESAVFVSHADSGDVWALRRTSDFRLTVADRIDLGGTLMPMALDRVRGLLHVVRRTEPLAVVSLSIGQESKLHRLAEMRLPASMAYLACTTDGNWMFSASYQGGTVSVLQLNGQGIPGRVQQSLFIGAKAHAVDIHPNGTHVFATSLGDDKLLVFGFDRTNGLLTLRSATACRPGSGPRHFRFHPKLSLVYVLHELDATIDVLAFDQATTKLNLVQTVCSMPQMAAGEPWAAELHLSPDGLWLFSTERRTSTLAVWKVNSKTGQLHNVQHHPTEATPRGMFVAADGRSVWVVGQDSHHLSNWAFSSATGSLTLIQRLSVGKNPNWIVAS